MVGGESSERRAASWLIGVALGVSMFGRKPPGWTKADMHEMATHLPCADAIHKGDGWSNPLQIWEMLDFCRSLGFEMTLAGAAEIQKSRKAGV